MTSIEGAAPVSGAHRMGARCPRVLVVGGSPEPIDAATLARLATGCTAVVAVDHGLDTLIEAQVPCDLFCGDADSVSGRGAALVHEAELGAGSFVARVERYDPHKDFTDLSLALRAIRERWGDASLLCTSLTGGRPDHFLAALGCIATWPGRVDWEETSYTARLLHPGEAWEIDGMAGRTFSFVCLSPEACVSERGMEWQLDRKRVRLLCDLGISNVLGEHARLTCHEGTVMAYVLR